MGSSAPQTSALFEAARDGKVRLGACWGGQGPHNPHNIEQLAGVWRTHGRAEPVKTFFERAARTLQELACTPHESGFHDDFGFDLLRWITEPTSAPVDEHLALAPISSPLNTVLGLLQYSIACHRLRCTPGEFASALTAITGHSQGIFVAAAVVLSNDWDSFWKASEFVLRLSFAAGLEGHHDNPPSRLSGAELQESIDRGFGNPAPMLGVSGLTAARLSTIIQDLNTKMTDQNGPLYHALENSRTRHVVSGPVRGLWKLCLLLDRMRAGEALDQTRVLLNERKPIITMRFLPISAPYHTPYLKAAARRVVENWGLLSFLTDHKLSLPLVHTLTGACVPSHSAEALIRSLAEAVMIDRVRWPEACDALNVSHALDFGPGRVGDLVSQSASPSGICVVNMTEAHSSTRSNFYSDEPLPSLVDWASAYGPRLSHSPQGALVETKMMKVFNCCSPVMVAGMVPTSVHPDFVVAVMKAGFHAELGGGGYSNEAKFEKAVREVAARVPPYRGVTCNILYANPQSVAWQVSCLRRLIREGVPVSGITVGAGIPSDDVVADLVETMGLRHISFKPGSAAAVERVVEIAKAYPTFPIGLQWTGGRAGGHHSLEDFHEVMLAKYAQIRSCPNVTLIAGSGFGGGEDSWPYVSGEWSVEYGYSRMPFDGVLLGSRMLVCKEAHTSRAAKVLISHTPDVGDAEWQHSYSKPAGGVVTIVSEMGQPMHVLATRGVMLWKELDETLFSLRDSAARAAYLVQHRERIIARLNADSAKPWFAVDGRGCAVAVEDMTYREVLARMCELLFVRSQGRWIDASYRRLVLDFVQVAEERYGITVDAAHAPSTSTSTLTQAFAAHLGPAADHVLWPDDVFRLMALFRRRGQKPVPFVPALDERFETWYKKDSLWQSEDVEAVVDGDVQRVLVLQGPVAARHSTEVDESAADILGAISRYFASAAQQLLSPEHELLDTCIDHDIGAPRHDDDTHIDIGHALTACNGLEIHQHDRLLSYRFLPSGRHPSPDDFRHALAGTTPWLQAALDTDRIFSGHSWRDNPIRAAFAPVAGDIVEVRLASGSAKTQSVTLLSCQANNRPENKPALRIALEDSSATPTVVVTLTPPLSHTDADASIDLRYALQTDHGGARLHQQDSHHLDAFTQLYRQLWLPHGACPPARPAGLFSVYQRQHVHLSTDVVAKFEATIRRTASSRVNTWTPDMPIPLDICLVFAWEALISPLVHEDLKCDFVHLLHQSADIEQHPSVQPLMVDDVVHTTSRITTLSDSASGRKVEVCAHIVREGDTVVTVKTVFFLRRLSATQSLTQFREEEEPEMIFHADTSLRKALILDRQWLHLDSDCPDIDGNSLVFRLVRRTGTINTNGNANALQVRGEAFALDANKRLDRVGTVDFKTTDETDNVVMSFLHRHGSERWPRQALKQPGWTGLNAIHFNAPVQSRSYALASTDLNPIHVCPVFARFAGLPGTVVHGMNTSAIVKRLVQNALGDTSRSRCQRWKVTWEGMVRPGDDLAIEFQHSAMERGAMVIDIEVRNTRTGEKVLSAEALVEQPSSAYVFCGQGSQKQGMGMKLYEESSVAKAIWDRGDKHLHDKFGFSILKIVRENPERLRVKFGGKRGRIVRNNFLSMTGETERKCAVPGVTPLSLEHTFFEQRGLLFSTQFSQPALLLMELAEFEHLRHTGVIKEDAPFAGHSLGEYAALGACTSFMPLEHLLELLFFRGSKMQNALQRDRQGRTEYAMMAVDPSRVGNGLNESTLQTIVTLIASEMKELLEVVNFNAKSQQYVCAGHFRTLFVLGQMLDRFSALPTVDKAQLKQVIVVEAAAAKTITSSDALQRGKASIPLRGIDVPFHSTLLRPGVPQYRKYLSERISVEDVRPSELVDRWIPNVTGTTFSINKDYIEEVTRMTGSQQLRGLIPGMA
ncbi:aflB fas-1 fatty acid synthase beta subunit [Lecanosticta acicola]|uniref:AflB fas-1 fatty acid synthase beta subunit n=1 Tax=Lecanosticta acicola TaxID=111012 RepID=A0AAI8Z8L8_9PEZI|nr:aflB fas-1 fatty acid synthase beta subunit [Lecanosticta acicola]